MCASSSANVRPRTAQTVAFRNFSFIALYGLWTFPSLYRVCIHLEATSYYIFFLRFTYRFSFIIVFRFYFTHIIEHIAEQYSDQLTFNGVLYEVNPFDLKKSVQIQFLYISESSKYWNIRFASDRKQSFFLSFSEEKIIIVSNLLQATKTPWQIRVCDTNQ